MTPDLAALPMGWYLCRLDSGERVYLWSASGIPERIEWPDGSGHLRQVLEAARTAKPEGVKHGVA